MDASKLLVAAVSLIEDFYCNVKIIFHQMQQVVVWQSLDATGATFVTLIYQKSFANN
jgi:hypothetical protein